MLSLVLSIGLFSQEKTENKGVFFNEGTLAETLAKAKSNKNGPNLVFLDCYTTWCGPCKQMANVIFPMEHVGNFFNTNFVNIKIDMEKGEGIELAKKYSIRAYPTFLILDSDGNEINRVVGGGEADTFIALVKKAMDPQTSPKVKHESYLNQKNAITAKAYIEALEQAYLRDQVSTFIEEEFSAWSPRVKYSEGLWKYISETFSNPKSKVFDLIIADKLTADSFIGKQRLDKAICDGLKTVAATFVSGKIQDVDNNSIISKINYLALLSSQDPTAWYFIEVPKLYVENNIDQIITMMKSKDFISLGERERAPLERLMLSTKGFSKKHLLEYTQAKIDYYKEMSEKSETVKSRI